jgi:hypothetical protein
MKSIIVLAAASLVCLTLLPQDASAQRRIGYRGVGVRAAVVGVRAPLVYRSYAAYRPYASYRYRYARPYYRAAAYRPYYYSYAAYRPVYSSYASYRPSYAYNSAYYSYASYQPAYSSSYQVDAGPGRTCTIYPSGFRWCWTYF